MKIAIGSPVYGGCEPGFVQALTETLMLLHERGHEAEWRYVTGSVLHANRNILADQQLRSGADVLLQIDTDLVWSARDLLNAIECVGEGRADLVGFPVSARRGERQLISPQLVPANECAPSKPKLPFQGFVHDGARYIEVKRVCSIVVASRACIEQLSENAERNQLDDHAILFDFARATDGHYIGEDSFFCQRWRASGGKIFCNIDAITGHTGQVSYSSRVCTAALEGLPFDWQAEAAE